MRWTVALLAYAIVAAVVAAPVVAERAIERARFADQLGTFPVDVSLSHNGTSSLDTGLMGTVYWRRTGYAGFGAALRSTGPPVAGGTLSSYVTPRFLKVNARFLGQPDDVARVYGAELRDQLVGWFLLAEGVVAAVGGVLLLAVFRGRVPPVPRRVTARGAQWAIRAGYVATAFGLVLAVALTQFGRWEGSAEPGVLYPMPGHEALSFSSPQAREIAVQVEPFITKMSSRMRERSASYVEAAGASAEAVLAAHATGLAPREGEVVVIAEADPQGSQVATEVRTALYPLLDDVLGGDAVVLRTIAGDVSSNGTVAERGFVQDEVTANGDVPTVAVKGDHDSAETLDQLRAAGARVLDLEVATVGGLRVAGASDPASKTLFGGISTNESGTSEAAVGAGLRTVVEEELDPLESVAVVLHQPRAAAGYLGVGSVADLAGAPGHDTVPYDDGVADVPPGMVTIGHLHDADGPWVLWNTDGDEVTWTVVSQLGTSGGVEESPTFNRFSTPFSVPLKDVSMRLSYVNPVSGLQTGYASIVIGTDGAVAVDDRVDVGLPGGLPAPASAVGPAPGRVAAR